MKNIYLFLIVCLFALLHFIVNKINVWQLPQSLIQKPVLIQGVIDSIPVKKFRGTEFQFRTEKINHEKIHTKFLISWYQDAPSLHVGERWQFTAQLKPPIGSHNPGGFDYEQFLKSEGVTATGYVDHDTTYHFNGIDHHYFIAQFRENTETDIKKSIHNPTLAAFISALCIGLRDGLTKSDWHVLQKTGTNHLVAIAGLHIGFVAMIIYFLTNRLWRLSTKLLLFLPVSRASEMSALISVLCYTALSGFAIPAERASIMLFVLMAGHILYRRVSMWRRFFMAASIILIFNAMNLLNAGFWLSFISIAILAWILTGRLQSKNSLKFHAKMQAGLLMGLLPVLFLFFHQISLISFFTNTVAIPWVGFIILPIALLATLLNLLSLHLFSHYLFWLSGKCLLPLWQFLKLSSHLFFASWYHAILNPWVLFFGMIGIIFLLAPRGFPAKYAGCFGLLPLFFYHASSLKEGDYRVTVLDVGQGLSVLVQTKNHVMLYDTGAHFPHGFDYGESVVAPYLQSQNIKTIDRLEISHGDNDHSGGADAIVKDFHVDSIVSSAPKLIAHFHGQYCFAGQNWIWDHVHFTTINPVPNSSYADNNSSCVIKISNAHTQMLLTGDIQKETEYALVAHYPTQLHATVLLVPHHGSRTSSSPLFLQAVSPKIAIISAGQLNRYHLPAANILSRYQNDHITVYNTAHSGAIIIRFSNLGQVKLRSDLK